MTFMIGCVNRECLIRSRFCAPSRIGCGGLGFLLRQARHRLGHEGARAHPRLGKAFADQTLKGGDGGGPRQLEPPGQVAGGGQLGPGGHRPAFDQGANGGI